MSFRDFVKEELSAFEERFLERLSESVRSAAGSGLLNGLRYAASQGWTLRCVDLDAEGDVLSELLNGRQTADGIEPEDFYSELNSRVFRAVEHTPGIDFNKLVELAEAAGFVDAKEGIAALWWAPCISSNAFRDKRNRLRLLAKKRRAIAALEQAIEDIASGKPTPLFGWALWVEEHSQTYDSLLAESLPLPPDSETA